MIHIRLEQFADNAGISYVHEQAFGRQEEANLVQTLRTERKITLALVATTDTQIVGHIVFSPIAIGHNVPSYKMVALGPLAVLPALQHQGIGSQLVEVGLTHCRQLGMALCVVLGHPNYYPRFGFVPAKPLGITCPFPVPDEVFMVLELTPHTLSNVQGEVQYASAFHQI